jgi:hypothetical protein
MTLIWRLKLESHSLGELKALDPSLTTIVCSDNGAVPHMVERQFDDVARPSGILRDCLSEMNLGIVPTILRLHFGARNHPRRDVAIEIKLRPLSHNGVAEPYARERNESRA